MAQSWSGERKWGKRDDRVGVKDVGGKKGWPGVRADFHFSPSAYVKMLSLSPSQVLPLQIPELSVRNGLQGGAGRARGRKSGKISILNKHNFVMVSPDYHGSSSAMFHNFLSLFCFFLAPFSLHLSQKLFMAVFPP